MALAYAIAVGYPFQWWRINGAEIRSGYGAFSDAGILLVDDGDQWLREAKASDQIYVHLVARTFLEDQEGPARILTISDSTSRRNFTVGQQGADLVIRLRRSLATLNGTPDYVLPDVFTDFAAHEVIAAIRHNVLRVYVDRQLRLDRVLPDHAISVWNVNFDIALGNEISLNRPWLGELTTAYMRMADRTFDLLDPRVLRKPLLLSTVNRPALVSSDRSDLLLNFVALLPIGFLSAGCLRRPRPIVVALIWLPICMFFEGTQIMTPGRFPSLSDVTMNVSGALVGAALFTAALHASTIAKVHAWLNGGNDIEGS